MLLHISITYIQLDYCYKAWVRERASNFAEFVQIQLEYLLTYRIPRCFFEKSDASKRTD